MSKRSDVDLHDDIQLKDHLHIQFIRASDGTVVGERVSDSDGRKTSVDVDPDDGQIRLRDEGRPPRGREGEEATAAMIAAELVRRGELDPGFRVRPVAETDDDVDCVIEGTAGGAPTRVRVQVTRVIETEVYAALGAGKSVDRTLDVDALVEAIGRAVARKIGRAGVVLALDARELGAAYVSEGVVRRAREMGVRGGFDAIYIAGPSDVRRVDAD